MFGLTFEKVLIIGIIAVFLLGPEKLPHYAAQLGRLVRQLRDMANGAKDRLRDEMGPEFDELDWKKLDPRQYDPRRIIREALTEEEPVKPQSATIGRASPAAASLLGAATGGAALTPITAAAPLAAPFDAEAT
ncbi:translocase [Cryobacterium sp. MLB-32]|uniref:twin-arginine translocase TatA/TatE family subunit n=1 Tax=Cryobacterium sp. MLB-32 TaxID=1529318 RepID=UPI0004E77DDD|nr:twin-arginine translocase TatA/TatE family subunit [Cryobacterium sp. MLB-32]KFF59671.1 translocase [Cryobacterium sp. MLB-32]